MFCDSLSVDQHRGLVFGFQGFISGKKLIILEVKHMSFHCYTTELQKTMLQILSARTLPVPACVMATRWTVLDSFLGIGAI